MNSLKNPTVVRPASKTPVGFVAGRVMGLATAGLKGPPQIPGNKPTIAGSSHQQQLQPPSLPRKPTAAESRFIGSCTKKVLNAEMNKDANSNVAGSDSGGLTVKDKLKLFATAYNIAEDKPSIIKPKPSVSNETRSRSVGRPQTKPVSSASSAAPVPPTVVRPPEKTAPQATASSTVSAMRAMLESNRHESHTTAPGSSQSPKVAAPTVVKPGLPSKVPSSNMSKSLAFDAPISTPSTATRDLSDAVSSAGVKNLRAKLEQELNFGGPPKPTVILPTSRSLEFSQQQQQQQTDADQHHQFSHGSNNHGTSQSLRKSSRQSQDSTEYANFPPQIPQSSGHVTQRKESVPCRPPPPRPASMSQSPKQDALYEPHAIVCYDFHSEEEDELCSKVGDLVLMKREVNAEWIIGINMRTNHLGIIPYSYLDVKLPLPQPAHSPGKAQTPPAKPVLSQQKPVESHVTKTPPAPKGPAAPPALLPASYLYDEPPDDDSGVESFSDGPRVYTLYDFKSETPGDLAFFSGEILRLVARIGPDWMEGESCDGRRGIFPSNFVEVIEDIADISLPQPDLRNGSLQNNAPSARKSSGEMRQPAEHQAAVNYGSNNIATAKYIFNATGEADLQLGVGDKIRVISAVNSEWLYGEKLDSRGSVVAAGMFPSGFVDHIPPNLSSFHDGSGQCFSSPPAQQHAGASIRTSITLTDDKSDSTYKKSERVAIALYDYFSKNPQDLYFEAGDRIVIDQEVDADWLMGHVILDLTNQRQLPSGYFPRSYVTFNAADTNNNAREA